MWLVGTLVAPSNGNEPKAVSVGWPVQRVFTRLIAVPVFAPKNAYTPLQSSIMWPMYSIAQVADQSPEFQARLIVPRCFGVPPTVVVEPVCPTKVVVPERSWLLSAPLP